MNPFRRTKQTHQSSNESSNEPSVSDNEEERVDMLMESLVPDKTVKVIHKRKSSISSSIQEIDCVRDEIKKMSRINDTFSNLLHSYESIFTQEERTQLSLKISNLIRDGNTTAAQCRYSIQSIKLQYNSMKREKMSSSMINLYSQSYASMAHTFVEVVAAYQSLQSRYEKDLEETYSQLQSIEEKQEQQEPLVQEQQMSILPHQLMDACMESQIQYREIVKIQKSMKEIQQLFLDLALLIDEQGEIIDRVQVDIDTTVDRTQQTNTALEESITRMKRMRKLKCCIIGTVVILIIVAVLCAYLFIKATI